MLGFLIELMLLLGDLKAGLGKWGQTWLGFLLRKQAQFTDQVS